MTQRLRAAVVGVGVGKQHISSYQSLPDMFEVVAVCDLNADKAREVAEQMDVPRVTTSLDELCRMDDVDVISIATPPAVHFEQMQQVLEAGKYAICEKPLVGSLKALDEIQRIEASSGKRVMPIFQYRFGHGLQKLKFLVDQGLAGTAYVSTAEMAWRRREPYYAVPWRGKWQTELGGTLLNHAIHVNDMLTYILGPVKNVFARTATRIHQIEVEDCASVSLEMADGSLASITATVGSTPEITRHRFCFQDFTAESNIDPYNNSYDPWTFSGDTPELQAQIDEALTRFVPLPQRFPGQFYRFYEAIQNGTELPVTLADARASLELITAMYYSGREHVPVELPIGTDHPAYASWAPPEA